MISAKVRTIRCFLVGCGEFEWKKKDFAPMKTGARAFAVALAIAAGGPLTAETLSEAVQKALSTNPG